MLYNKTGNYEEAIEVIDSMEEDIQESREVILFKHDVFNEMRKYDSAVYELELITKYFPDDISGYGMLAEYLSEIGKMNYARKVYNEILEKDSLNGVAILSFTKILFTIE